MALFQADYVDDEDPYATVQFVPKSKRKQEVNDSSQNEETAYASIADFKRNP